jgi:3-dehydroquinate synthase
MTAEGRRDGGTTRVRKITVKVKPRAYDALIENGLLRSGGARIAETMGRSPRVFVVTVPPVRKRWGSILRKSLAAAGLQHDWLEMADGERQKRLDAVEKLATKLVQRHADRGAIIVALGGGVVGDVAGMLASIYMRGIDVIQVPTTFLAQVDASIGGKTGVNLAVGKNLLGTFHQPRAVLIDPQVLKTLPEREYRSGLYEALKCGIIGRPDIFNYMERHRERILQRDPESLEWLIAECVQVKADVVTADERESGLRRVLNFGHTVGHALEADTSYKHFLHGEAVAWGMVAACSIAVAMKKVSEETAHRITSLVREYAPLPKVKSRGPRIVRLLVSDKKTQNGVVHFVLPREIGKVEIVNDVPTQAVVKAVEELRRLSKT